MADNNTPLPTGDAAQMAAVLRDLKERMRTMETTGSLPSSSIAGGRLSVVNDEGTSDLVVLGEITLTTTNPPGTEVDRGILVQDSDGQEIFLATRNHGVIKPLEQWEWRVPSTVATSTSATFETKWQSVIMSLPTSALVVVVNAFVDAATTGEIRLNVLDSSSHIINTDAYTLTTSPAYYTFKVDAAGGGIPRNENVFVNVQIRRTGGAGNVNVYEPMPCHAWDTTIYGASVDGIYP